MSIVGDLKNSVGSHSKFYHPPTFPGFPELMEVDEVCFLMGFFPLTVSEVNLTEDFEQLESVSGVSKDTFLTPFLTRPFFMMPFVDGGLFSKLGEGIFLSSCNISTL